MFRIVFHYKSTLGAAYTNFYRPSSVTTSNGIFTCGKVMFSQARVKNSVPMGVYSLPHWGRHPLQTETPRADTPWADTPLGRHPFPRDSHYSGQCASYWNVFLWLLQVLLIKGPFTPSDTTATAMTLAILL